MKRYQINVQQPATVIPKEHQIAWKLAEVAFNQVSLNTNVINMVKNRIIDNYAVAIAAINAFPVITARDMALCKLKKNGSPIIGFGKNKLVSCEWATWANGTAIRQLDYNDTYLSADYSHPSDNIPALIAVAQKMNKPGMSLIRAIAVSYEIHVRLVDAICLHKHKIDHILHLGISIVVGLGALLNCSQDVIYEAIQQVAHTTLTTRQSRKGEISSWKAFAPAYAGKQAIESLDRCMRGEKSPNPIFEGSDSFVSQILDGPLSDYTLWLPDKNCPIEAILNTYAKEHSAEYQAQAFIDCAIELHHENLNLAEIKSIIIETSHHTHFVIGTGSNDVEKTNLNCSRETLDHSLMYIFSVALEDGAWDHEMSYPPKRLPTAITKHLIQRINTKETRLWTAAYHDSNPMKKKFGGMVTIYFKNNSMKTKTIDVAHAHPNGKTPFKRHDYLSKFNRCTDRLVNNKERERFIDAVLHLDSAKNCDSLFLACEPGIIKKHKVQGLLS